MESATGWDWIFPSCGFSLSKEPGKMEAGTPSNTDEALHHLSLCKCYNLVFSQKEEERKKTHPPGGDDVTSLVSKQLHEFKEFENVPEISHS